MIAVTFTLSASVDAFDAAAQQTFTANLAAQLDGVSASDIQLTVEAGSLLVGVQIIVPDAADVGTLITELSSPQTAAALGSAVEAVSVPIVEMHAFAAPSPPPLAPAVATSTNPLSAVVASLGDSSTAVAVAIAAVAVILCCGIGLCVVRRRRRGSKRAARTQDPTPGIVLQQNLSQRSSALLPESFDRVLLTTRVRRLQPMLRPDQTAAWILHAPGVLRASAASDSELRITKGRLYLEQAAAEGAVDSGGAQHGVLEQWPLATVASVKRSRHEMRHSALELTLASQHAGQSGAQGLLMLDFSSRDERERVIATLRSERPQLLPPDDRLEALTEQWHRGEVDNYTYLLHLNECASRSFADIAQYPIMPWVLTDYSSESLDLSDPRVYRPLWRAVGALDEKRLRGLHSRRLELLPDAEEPEAEPLYHTHYSSPAYVAFFLLRVHPELTIHIQSGRFDQPSRTFANVHEMWQQVRGGAGDVKELVPEFYSSDGAFLTNELGIAPADPVGLPPWANGSPNEFVRLMRAALESEYVSAHLHLWIDLIFGSKQASIRADNLFHPYTYEAAMRRDAAADANAAELVLAYASECGQTPPQLFSRPHAPRRLRLRRGLPWRAAEPAATLIQTNVRRWLIRRHLEEIAVAFFFDEGMLRSAADDPARVADGMPAGEASPSLEEPSLEEPSVDILQRSAGGYRLECSKLTAEWLLALTNEPEHEVSGYLESCFRSDDQRTHHPSERHPFAHMLAELTLLAIRLLGSEGGRRASRMSASARLAALSTLVQLGVRRACAVITSVLPPLAEPGRVDVVRGLVLEEMSARLFRPLTMPLIQSVHAADDAVYAQRLAAFGGALMPHHFHHVSNLPRRFWLGSDARTSDAPLPYQNAIRKLHGLSATYSTRKKLGVLMEVLATTQQHVWRHHGVSSLEDQALEANLRLQLAADDLVTCLP